MNTGSRWYSPVQDTLGINFGKKCNALRGAVIMLQNVFIIALSFLLLISISGCGWSDGCPLPTDTRVVDSAAHWEIQSVSLTNFNPTVSDDDNFTLPSGYLTDVSSFTSITSNADDRLFAAYDTSVGGVVINTFPLLWWDESNPPQLMVDFCLPGAPSLDSLTSSFCRVARSITENHECQDIDSENRTCIYTFQEFDVSDLSGESSTVFHLSGSSEINSIEEYIPETSHCMGIGD